MNATRLPAIFLANRYKTGIARTPLIAGKSRKEKADAPNISNAAFTNNKYSEPKFSHKAKGFAR